MDSGWWIVDSGYRKFIAALLVFISLTVGSYANENNSAGSLRSAPDFQLTDLNDQPVFLSDYKDKQAVILFFWTTWCPYCRDELKTLNQQYVELAKDAVKVLAINVGESKYKVDNFVQSRNLAFTVLLDKDSTVASAYDLLGFPSYFVINKAGQIIATGNNFPKDALKELAGK